MKKLVLMASVFLFFSCTSIRKEYYPINDYLDSIANNRDIIVVNKKISNKRTFNVINGNFLFNTKTNSLERIGNQSKLYNKTDFEDLVENYCCDTIDSFWIEEDFKTKNVTLINEGRFINNKIGKDLLKNKELPVYMFSDPLKYNNDSFRLFTVLKSTTSFAAPTSEFIIIMKKNDQKWVVVDKIWADENYID